jgi:hypothetical protein
VPAHDTPDCRLAQRLTRDAEALAAVVAPADVRRLHVVDLGTLPADAGRHMVGASIGSGHAWAVHLGYRDGGAAVGCAIALVAAEAAQRQLAADNVQALVDGIVLHEVAHSLTYDDVDPARAGELFDRLATHGVPSYTPADTTAAHCGRWAGVLCVLGDRAQRYRRRTQHMLEHLVTDDLASYGHSITALRRIIGTVDDDQPLRELFKSPPLVTQLALAKSSQPIPPARSTSRDAVAARTTHEVIRWRSMCLS